MCAIPCAQSDQPRPTIRGRKRSTLEVISDSVQCSRLRFVPVLQAPPDVKDRAGHDEQTGEEDSPPKRTRVRSQRLGASQGSGPPHTTSKGLFVSPEESCGELRENSTPMVLGIRKATSLITAAAEKESDADREPSPERQKSIAQSEHAEIFSRKKLRGRQTTLSSIPDAPRRCR